MSELNKEENQKQKKKMQKQNYILIFFLLLCTIVFISITIIAIEITNQNQAQAEKEPSQNILSEEKVKEEKELAVALTDTYKTNALEIEEYWYLDGRIKSVKQAELEDNFDMDNFLQVVRFPQIKGLKNKTIETNINEEIKSKMIEEIEKKRLVYVQAYGNFSNVLSVEITSSEQDEQTNDTTSIGLNYRLDTGEKIKFEDLFTSKAYAKTILSQSTYKSLASSYILGDEKGWADATKKDYSKIELEAFEIVQTYLANPNINFFFSPLEIYARIGGKYITINMADYHQNIAIYKRYAKRNDLYEDNSKAYQGIYVFSSRLINEYNLYYYQLKQVTDNLFTDIWLYDIENTGNKDKEIKKMQEILEEVKQEAKQNPNKAYIFTYFTFSDERNFTIMKYEMDKKYYEQYGKDLIARANRDASVFDGSADIEVYYNNIQDGKENKNITPYVYDENRFITQKEWEER